MATPKLLVFVLGAPGAGKGTQSDLIVKEFGWTHVSAGDLLRAEVQKGTEWGKQAEEIMREGKMVPGSMIIGLLKGALSSGEHTKVLVDGFPRVLEQLHDFEQQVRPCNTALFYNVAEDIARQRLLQRSESSGRVDDNEETIHKRFVVFEEQSMPVVEALREQCRLSEVDAAAAPEEVYAATKQIIQQLEQELAASEAAAASVAAAEAGPAGAADWAEEAAAAAAAAAEAAAAIAVAAEAAAPAVAAEAAAPAAASSDAAAQPAAAAAVEQQELAVPVAAAAVPAAVAAVAAADAVAAEVPAVELAAAAAEVPAEVASAAVMPAVQMDLSGIRTPIVICGPSGVGKGTLIGKLMAQHPDKFGFSVSHTTRGPRPGEQHGVHYYFTDTDAMSAQVAAGMFLEHAQVHGNMYGTSLAAVARVSSEGKHCVLDIDVQGAQQVRASALGDRCLFIFVAPPSKAELERRLRNRGTETEDKVLQRLANATSEIAKAQEPGLFHHTLVNGDLEQAYLQLQRLINSRVPGLLPEADAAAAAATAVQEAEQAAAAVSTDASSAQPAADAAATADASSAAPAPAAIAAAAPEPVAATNGTAAAAGTGVTAAAAAAAAATAVAHGNGGTSTLLDFGFGASAGPAVAAKGMPVRQYMDVTVIPVLREGLKALNVARPDDPWQFLADYLVANKPLAHA